METTRRTFLITAAGAVTVGSLLIASGPGQEQKGLKKKVQDRQGGERQEDVSAPEDLMREHGVLNRVLLIYEEGLRRLRSNQEMNPDGFHRPAELVRRFVEDYHER